MTVVGRLLKSSGHLAERIGGGPRFKIGNHVRFDIQPIVRLVACITDIVFAGKCGVPRRGIEPRNLPIFSRTLYQLSYLGVWCLLI
jgi:hypothetical protein